MEDREAGKNELLVPFVVAENGWIILKIINL